SMIPLALNDEKVSTVAIKNPRTVVSSAATMAIQNEFHNPSSMRDPAPKTSAKCSVVKFEGVRPPWVVLVSATCKEVPIGMPNEIRVINMLMPDHSQGRRASGSCCLRA